MPCLIEILERFGWRVFHNRRRLSRLTKQIQIAVEKSQPTTTLESKEEELSAELARYGGLLNDCAEWIRVRTGIPTSKLVEVATSTAFTDGEDRDHIYAELRKLDERGVTAELWKALLSQDQDALVSVKLWSSSETSLPATETDGQAEKADPDNVTKLIEGIVSALKNTVVNGEEGTSTSGRKKIKKCEQLAYSAFQYAESLKEQELEDRAAWDYLKEHGISKVRDDLQNLQSYELPSLETFTTHLSRARRALGVLKYEKGKRPRSKCVAKRSEID